MPRNSYNLCLSLFLCLSLRELSSELRSKVCNFGLDCSDTYLQLLLDFFSQFPFLSVSIVVIFSTFEKTSHHKQTLSSNMSMSSSTSYHLLVLLALLFSVVDTASFFAFVRVISRDCVSGSSLSTILKILPFT